MNELLTLPEVANLLRTPESTLRHWRHNHAGPPAIKVGKRLLYRREDVETWLEMKAATA